MERLQPLTASITGIDGTGKNTALQTAVNRLSPTYKIGVLGKPAYVVDSLTTRNIHGLLTQGSDMIHMAANKTGLKPLSTFASALDVATQGRVIQRKLENTNPHLIIGPRDYIIDPAVYSIFYAGIIAGKTPSQRLDFFRLASGMHLRDVIFQLTVDPDEAVQRIFKREKEQSGGNTNMRTPGRYMHEERSHLEKLQNEYPVILAAVKRQGVNNIHTVNTSALSEPQVANTVTATLEQHLHDRNI